MIAIDLNPLSRTAQQASITIVDNVTRALPRIEYWVGALLEKKLGGLEPMVLSWDNTQNLHNVLVFLSKRLNALF